MLFPKVIKSLLYRYLILKLMREKKRYGYEILKEIKRMSGGHWKPSYGTVYGTLGRMEERGLIKRTEGTDGERKYFKLTDKGKERLKRDEETEREFQKKIKSTVLGFLNIYRYIFGEKELKELKNDIEEGSKKYSMNGGGIL